MGLFKPDLYRSFAIGFALGAAAFAGAMNLRADTKQGGMIASAQAAPVAIDQTR